MQLPGEDRHTYSKTYLQNNLAVLFGGRAAEELVCSTITTGAGNDIERATALAKRMVCEWGMSDEFGPMALGKKDEQVFLGRDITHIKDYSEETARLIDQEVRRILSEAYGTAKRILEEQRAVLEALAQALVERETLTGEEVDLIMHGKELPQAEEFALEEENDVSGDA
jgi:cell division protease FtsH